MLTRTYYAPTFIDESMSSRDRRGNQHPTGRLSGCLITRKFTLTKKRTVRGERGVVFFSWDSDTQEAKAAALAKAIEGMNGELPGLDDNPPTNWIPDFIKREMQDEVSKAVVC